MSYFSPPFIISQSSGDVKYLTPLFHRINDLSNVSSIERRVIMPSGLFGIEHTNRADANHWTKNCFNSSFPTALACYMMEHDIPAIYARLGVVRGQLKKSFVAEISMLQISNLTLNPNLSLTNSTPLTTLME